MEDWVDMKRGVNNLYEFNDGTILSREQLENIFTEMALIAFKPTQKYDTESYEIRADLEYLFGIGREIKRKQLW